LAGGGTNLFAGGSFGWLGQTNANMVARFDGTNWYPLGSGISGPSGVLTPIGVSILTLAVVSNCVYAGGFFTSAGGVIVTNVAKWDGTNWSAVGNPGGAVAALLVRPDGVYASGAPFYSSTQFGSPFFSRWDGTNWNGVINYPPMTDTLFYFADANFGMAALAGIDTNVFIGGHFSIGQNGTNCDNIMRFDGTYAWIVGSGFNSNVTCLAALGTNLYAAGTFTNAGGVAASKIAMWNGSYWTNMGSGVVGANSINAIAVMGGNVYVGGSFTNMGGVTVNHIAKWDGTNWSALGNGTTLPPSATGTIVSMAASGSDLYVSGTFRMTGNKNSFNIGRWNEQTNFDTPQVRALGASNGTFRLRLSGTAGRTNVVQATTNFSDWTSVLTNSTGIYDFTDPNAASYPFRFYRGLLLP
jgi:hypothetical protein